MDLSRRFFVFATLATGLLCLSGCTGRDSNVGYVTGTLTVDGDAIADALVIFSPTTGRASAGYTNEDGVYVLKYVARQKGARIGKHKVYVTIENAPDGEGEYSLERKPRKKKKKRLKEKLPKKYSDPKETELTATVTSGSNTIDFDLSTK